MDKINAKTPDHLADHIDQTQTVIAKFADSPTPTGFTDAELARLDELCRTATPGPWTVMTEDAVECSWVVAAISSDDRAIALFDYREAAANRTDAQFTAAARMALPRAIAVVQTLLGRVSDLLAANNAEVLHRQNIQKEHDTLIAKLAAQKAESGKN